MITTHRIAALLALVPIGLACGGPPAASRDGGHQSASAAPTAPPAPAASSGVASVAQGAGATVREVNASGMGGAYDPATVTVRSGAAVRWLNDSGNVHNVTFADAALKASPIMYRGDSFEMVFAVAGTHRYRCTFHPGMDGVVVVT